MKRRLSFFFLLLVLAAVFVADDQAEQIKLSQSPNIIVYNYQTGERSIMTPEEYGSSATMQSNVALTTPGYDPEPTLSPDVIIEEDDENPYDSRQQVNPSNFPYNRILRLVIGADENHDGTTDVWKVGTGFLVGNNLMLTAGHCAYNYVTQQEQPMYIYVMQNNNKPPLEYYTPLEYHIPDPYKNYGRQDYDWCLIELSENIGATTGYFTCTTTVNSATSVSVSGYPEDYRYYQYMSTGTVTSCSSYLFRHTCDTMGGQSGAPLYNSSKVVVGIHTGGSETGNYNQAVRITSEIISLISSLNSN